MVASIAVVEDEPELRLLYCIMLKSRGYAVSFTASGVEQAVQAYSDAVVKPGVVVMDVRLEDGSGVDAAARILSADPAARFIFATAEANSVTGLPAHAIVDILQKPFSLTDLCEKIQVALSSPISSHQHLYSGYARPEAEEYKYNAV